jgi:hypothetical protein
MRETIVNKSQEENKNKKAYTGCKKTNWPGISGIKIFVSHRGCFQKQTLK